MENEPAYIEYANFRSLRHLIHNNVELYLVSCGIENCSSKHSYGPGQRDKYLIHYVLSGTGVFKVGDKSYIVMPGQAFIIYPDTTISYEADEKNPWTYTWVGFNGTMVDSYLDQAAITPNTHVITMSEDTSFHNIVKQMLSKKKLTYSNELIRQSLLLQLLAELIEFRQSSNSYYASYNYPYKVYVEQALYYISQEYMNNLSVNDLATHIGITRSYLNKCFNQILELSPKQYIIKYRMDKACQLMKSTRMNIMEITEAVGYNDSLTFSKAFKTYKGLSPSAWRNQQ